MAAPRKTATGKTPDAAENIKWSDVGPTDRSPQVFGMFGPTVEAPDTVIDPNPEPIIPEVDRRA